MEVNGGKGLVSMVVQNYVEEGVHMHMVGLVGNYKGSTIFIILVRSLEWLLTIVIWWRWFVTKRSTITIVLVCIVEWSLSVVLWKVLLPERLIRSSWLRPSLIALTLMHIPVIAFSSCNIVVIRLNSKRGESS